MIDEPHPTFSTWPLSCLRVGKEITWFCGHTKPTGNSPAPLSHFPYIPPPSPVFYIVNYVLHSEECVNVCLQPGDDQNENAHKSHHLGREVGQCCFREPSQVPWWGHTLKPPPSSDPWESFSCRCKNFHSSEYGGVFHFVNRVITLHHTYEQVECPYSKNLTFKMHQNMIF